MSGPTLDDVLAAGRGVERPFCCPVHGDSNASASVNVLKGVWYCYACGANGRTDGKKTAPSTADLAAMLEPEQTARTYPEAYLELFDIAEWPGAYWHTRFPAWLCAMEHMGQDPFSGMATYPVRTPLGKLAGMVRRDPDGQPKYKYPYRWSASTVLDGLHHPRTDHVVLVEGRPDRVALTECGIPALGTFGAGMHFPQVEMLVRRAPSLVLLGFDMDEAGERAAERTAELLKEHDIETRLVTWPAKDPGDCTPAERREAVAEVVGSGVYVQSWSKRVRDYTARHAPSDEQMTGAR